MTVYADSFNRADTPAGSGLGSIPSGGPAWQVVAGSWRILGQRAHSDTPAASSPIAAIETLSADVDLSTAVSHLGGDAIYVRVVDAANWLRARVRRWTTTGTWTTYRTEYRCKFLWGEAPDQHGHTEYSAWTTSPQTCSQPSASYYHQHGDGYHSHPPNGAFQETREVPVTSYYTETHYQVILEKAAAGTVQALGTATVSTPSSLRLRAAGTSLKVYVNGASSAAISVVESTHLAATKHGIGRGPSELTGSGLDDVSFDTLNTAPNAPTVTVPAAVDIRQPVDVGVAFSDPDLGDSPSLARIRFGPASTSPSTWTVISRAGQVSSVRIPADTLTVGAWEVQGQSVDAGGKVSEWSSSKFFTAGETPDAPSIVAPVNGATIPTEDAVGEISHPSMDGWESRVLADDGSGNADESNVITPVASHDAATLAFAMSSLPDGAIVHPQARVVKDLLWSPWTTNTNPVSYTRPAIAGVAIEENFPTGAMSVRAIHPEPIGSQPDVVRVDWWRVEVGEDGTPLVEGDDGIPLERGRGLGPNEIFVDWEVRFSTTSSPHRYGYWALLHGDNGTSSRTPLQVTADDTAPLTPANFVATPTSDTTISLTWSPSLDDATDQAEIRYIIERDGELLTITDAGATSFVDADLTPDVGYVYSVAALDQAGNQSDPAEVIIVIPIDWGEGNYGEGWWTPAGSVPL